MNLDEVRIAAPDAASRHAGARDTKHAPRLADSAHTYRTDAGVSLDADHPTRGRAHVVNLQDHAGGAPELTLLASGPGFETALVHVAGDGWPGHTGNTTHAYLDSVLGGAPVLAAVQVPEPAPLALFALSAVVGTLVWRRRVHASTGADGAPR